MESITLGDLSKMIAFIVTIITAIEFLAFRMRKYIKSTMKDEIEPLKKELEENSLNTMKNSICNEMIPLSERVSIYKKYIDKGGNGAVKIYGHQLEEEYDKQIRERK